MTFEVKAKHGSFTKTVSRALSRLGLCQPGDALFPCPLRPMLATLGRAPFDDPAWVYEPKWDGFRFIAMIRGRARWSKAPTS